jgi:hypothetical protein
MLRQNTQFLDQQEELKNSLSQPNARFDKSIQDFFERYYSGLTVQKLYQLNPV